MNRDPADPIRVLLVEDDDVDVEAMRRAFRRSGVPHQIYVARDGIEAMRMLRGDSSGKPLSRPYLIVLDLNLPRMDGVEFLDALRKDEQLRDSIVFVLSTSDADRDKALAYGHHVAGYLVKAPTSAAFDVVRELLERYWMVVRPPPAEAPATPGPLSRSS